MAQNKDLVADAQTLQEENLSEKKSLASARRLLWPNILISFGNVHLFYTGYTEKNLRGLKTVLGCFS